jgi:23S rRNA-/tRNA-specific pseudouridylate synthase
MNIYSNRPAAALACAAFEQRAVHKEYLAVVEGHILSANHRPLHTWPLLHQDDAAREASDFIEQDYLTASAQRSSCTKTLKEMSSTSTSTSTWQEEVKIQNLEACFAVLHSQA